ncbi:MAG: putative quinol monooxygenase [Desulfocucumaceae bacterium]
MISLVAVLEAQPGKEAHLAEECAALAKSVRENEAGCLMYVPHVSVKNPAKIVFFEKYKDQEALEGHRQTPHYKAASAKFKEMLTGAPEVTILKEL